MFPFAQTADPGVTASPMLVNPPNMTTDGLDAPVVYDPPAQNPDHESGRFHPDRDDEDHETEYAPPPLEIVGVNMHAPSGHDTLPSRV